jgi:quinoprotein glucose dehydrogenase
VYLPVSGPTDNFYGGSRPGNNVFADSIVCLDIRTGKRVWHFQTIHHDLWDHDLPAPPNLVDLEVGGRKIRAVLQVGKTGFCYVFDRVTGEPVWPIEERPVPRSSMPGEKSSPTQPFPSKPPPFERQQLMEEDLIDFTPELNSQARRYLAKYDHGPQYTPPSQRGAVLLPGWSGGASWGGGAFDPETHRFYVPSITSPIVVRMQKLAFRRRLNNWFTSSTDIIEAPFEIDFVRMAELSGNLPITKPPYGRITAYDLDRGEIRWQVANGRGPANHPALAHKKLPNLGGTGRTGILITKELIFAGEGDSHKVAGGERMFRAYDKDTGKILWETAVDEHVTGAPMTYFVNGRQYVVVACGGMVEKHELVAYALPRGK